jgi:hypothetical protein
MKAARRLVVAIGGAALALAPVVARAQAAPPAATTTPAPDTVGPRELQNFSLGGTVTRQADTPPPPAARPARRPATDTATAQLPPAVDTPADRPARRVAERAAAETPAPQATAPATTLSLTTTPAQAAPQPSFTDAALPPSTEAAPASLAPEHSLILWPWLLLAAVAGGAIALLLWRRRSREAFAGEVDAYVAPEPPAPSPRPPVPAPAPAPKAPPKPAGIVSTRLRPWLEISFVPLGVVLDDQQLKLEFQLDILNSGAAPARDILVEASMFNAGPTQDDDIRAFFDKPVGQGERIEAIPPLQRVTLTHALIAPIANLQLFELGGKQVFIPLIAFNALYRWSGGKGQTSSSHLVGRQTKTDKLAPLRADQGARAIAGLAAHLLPTGVRS